MKASKKNKYKIKVKYQDGGLSNPVEPPKNQPTTQDSLLLYNNAIDKARFYSNNPLYEESFSESSNMHVPYLIMQGGSDRFNQEAKAMAEETNNKLGSVEPRFTKVNENINSYGDILRGHSNTIYNNQAPPIYLHKSILPHQWTGYSTVLDNKEGIDDLSDIPEYDPVKIYPKSLGNIPNEAYKYSDIKKGTRMLEQTPYTSNVDLPTIPKPYTPNMDTDLSAYLQSEGKSFKFSDRKKLAEEYGLKNYKGSANQNIELLNMIKAGSPVVKKNELKKEITPSVDKKVKKEIINTPTKVEQPHPLSKYKDDEYIEVETGTDRGTIKQIMKVKVSDLKKWKGNYKIVNPKTNTNVAQFGLGGAMNGAQTGAKYGAALGSVVPGVGNLLGMGIGALAGGIGGHFMEEKSISDMQSEQMANINAIDNQNPYGVITMEDGGLSVNNPLINIEVGELMVDKNTGDIIEEYSKERGFKSHSKKNEDSRNFVQSVENGVVVPKKMAKAYKDNPTLRSGYLRDIVNMQADRMMYGVDANGNKVEFSQIEQDASKMKNGGFAKKYFTGGLTPDGDKSIVDLRNNNNPSIWDAGNNFPKVPFYGDFNSINNLNNQGSAFFHKDNPFSYNVPYADTLVSMKPMGWQEDLYAHDSMETQGVTNRQNIPSVTPKNSPDIYNRTLPTPKSVNPGSFDVEGNFIPPQGNNPLSSKDNLWTTGNTIGAIGTGISALGPLGATLMNGMDRNESNHYSGVSTRAEGQVEDVFRGVERRGVRDINMAANIGQNLNRNRTTNFGSMLANAQNMNRGTQRNLGDFLNNVGSERAKIMADYMFKGDMTNAQGLTARDERLDANRDNFYSNLSANLSNAGVNIQGFGKNLNQNESNKVALNSLRNVSPDFKVNPDGTVTFRGQNYTQEQLEQLLKNYV